MGNRPSTADYTPVMRTFMKGDRLDTFMKAYNILSETEIPAFIQKHCYAVGAYINVDPKKRMVALHIIKLYRWYFEISSEDLDLLFLLTIEELNKKGPLVPKRIPDVYTIVSLYSEDQLKKVHEIFPECETPAKQAEAV